MYAEVVAFESTLSIRFDYVLQVGDFGIWTNDGVVDRATRNHGDVGNFPIMWEENKVMPYSTIFIKGNHENFMWLEKQRIEILPGLFYLKNGTRFNIGNSLPLFIGGIGGCFGSSSYNKKSIDLKEFKKRHYTREEIDTLINLGSVHIFVTHDSPHGLELEHGIRGKYETQSIGLDDVAKELKPKIWFFGHHHRYINTVVHGVKTVGLGRIE